MLTVRREQLNALTAVKIEQFIDDAIAMVRTYWPGTYARTDEKAMRARIDNAVILAEQHGIRSRRDVMRFINLTMLLGPDFPTDPRFPWAATILGKTSLHPAMKVELMMDEARSMLGGR